MKKVCACASRERLHVWEGTQPGGDAFLRENHKLLFNTQHTACKQGEALNFKDVELAFQIPGGSNFTAAASRE